MRGASRVARGVADVELDRQAELVRKAELSAEGELLRLLIDLVVGAEIEPDLAHSHGAPAGKKLTREPLGVVCVLGGAVRMASGNDAHVVKKGRNVPVGERGRRETALGGLLQAQAGDLDVSVEEVEKLRGAPPLARELAHGVHGDDEQPDAHERRAGERQRGVVELQAAQVTVSVREGRKRLRHGTGAAARIVEELAVREGQIVEDFKPGHVSFFPVYAGRRDAPLPVTA